MGNTITQAIGLSHNGADDHHAAYRTNSKKNKTKHATARRSYDENYYRKEAEYEIKSKTLPARHPHPRGAQRVNSHPSSQPGMQQKTENTIPQPNGQTSRVLFLLYLIHRTWNVMVDTMDTRSKKSRRGRTHSNDSIIPKSRGEQTSSGCTNMDTTISITDIDDLDNSSFCCSQYSLCTCSYCCSAPQNVYNSIADDCSIDSICQRSASMCDSSDFSPFYHGYQMTPSVCKNPPLSSVGGSVTGQNVNSNPRLICGQNITNASGCISVTSHTQISNFGGSINGSMASYKMSSSENSWPQAVFSKENQRPPVYNPEDYAQSLKKFSKRQSGQNARSIYDSSDATETMEETYKSSTLPTKHSEYKSPIPAPPKSESEMSLRQFSTITDLLTKLRADLRVSFPSFVQEFVATPSDGVSMLLEVLRAIQLSQATNASINVTHSSSMPRNSQSYQRRALLDELACLQCISICCSRSVEATARLGSTAVGLMPLASSATGQGIRARILAMQLMTSACDKHTFGHGSQKIVEAGHTAVSEAMSTLRLRCSEPVRFRLLVGMLNSGGGSGELQAVGVRFINSFLESASNLQQRLYLQAELFQAGFEPGSLAKTISSSSPWLDALRNEIKRFNEIYVDVDRMITQARDAERVRSQMVILERRVQILHEEKSVLTSMERRLQERCAELQREIFRLQGAHNGNTFKSLDKLDKQPVALPRHVPPPQNKHDSSEHEDEGISSSETGPSLSPVPILVLPQLQNKAGKHQHNSNSLNSSKENIKDLLQVPDDAAIENVMEQLDNVVSEAEKQLSANLQHNLYSATVQEEEIVPVNIVPQPPRKSRSLTHLVSPVAGSELEGSEYGVLLLPNAADAAAAERAAHLQTFFDDIDYNMPDTDKAYVLDMQEIPEMHNNAANSYNASTTRELLDVIMNARHNEDDPTIKALRETVTLENENNLKRSSYATATDKKPLAPAQQFNGVFFMTGMNTPQKYPKPDLTAALQARRVTKNVERLEAAFGNHTTELREKSRSNQQIYFGSNPTLRINTCYASYHSTNNNNINNNNNNNNLNINDDDICNNLNNINKIKDSSGNAKCSNPIMRARTYASGAKVTDIPSGLY